MTTTLKFLIGIFIVAILAGIVLIVLPGKSQAPTTNSQISTTTNTDPHADLIVADAPQINTVITSPLTITGKARGTWYFEATFPVKLYDTDTRKLIAEGQARAQGDWMTNEFVPFKATLTFINPPRDLPSDGGLLPHQGNLVLMKDNPSGDSARDDSISIPVVFQ